MVKCFSFCSFNKYEAFYSVLFVKVCLYYNTLFLSCNEGLIALLLRCVGRLSARKPVNHTSGVAVVTLTDRSKSVRNRCVIDVLVAFKFLVKLFFYFSVIAGSVDIGLSQISYLFFNKDNGNTKILLKVVWHITLFLYIYLTVGAIFWASWSALFWRSAHPMLLKVRLSYVTGRVVMLSLYLHKTQYINIFDWSVNIYYNNWHLTIMWKKRMQGGYYSRYIMEK